MVAKIGMGLVQVFDSFPAGYQTLKVLSVLYLIYLAYTIATAATPNEQAGVKGRLFSFSQAALFQWINPKAWTMTLTATNVYAPSQDTQAVLSVAIIFGVINLPSVSAWTAMGLQLKHLLNSQLRLKVFNYSMATLLIASLYPVLM